MENSFNPYESNQEENIQKKIAELESFVKSRMTKEAINRYGNIKTAFPDKALNLLMILSQYLQSNKISMIDDQTLKQILIYMNNLEQKKDFKITRR